MKNILIALAFSFLIFSSCNESQNNNVEQDEFFSQKNNENIENRVLKAITSLPEYDEAEDHVKAVTSGKQLLSSIIYPPDNENSNYYIQVGYNQEAWFEPYFHFYVNPETLEVFIEDLIEGDIITIEEWRLREDNR